MDKETYEAVKAVTVRALNEGGDLGEMLATVRMAWLDAEKEFRDRNRKRVAEQVARHDDVDYL